MSERAIERGYRQIGTLGSGNHYLEIQVLHREGIFDEKLARVFGLDLPDQVVIMFHCGSRGFGHQVATDYLHAFLRAMPTKFGLPVIDRELACAPFDSQEGQDYFKAMCCAANMSFANRQVILHRIREVLSQVFGRDAEALGVRQVYDVSHNTAKLEEHGEGRERRQLLVHRKGATRAFPPGHHELPDRYRVPLVLRYFADLDHAAIAEALGVSRGQVATLLLRARRRLRQELCQGRGER